MDLSRYLPAGQYRYYYGTLDRRLKSAYDRMLAAAMAYKEKVEISGCTSSELLATFGLMRRDVPELFFVDSITVRYPMDRKQECTVWFTYYLYRETAESMLQTIESKYSAFLEGLRWIPDFLKEERIHDRLCLEVTYEQIEGMLCYDAPGALLYGAAVCSGISKAFKFLADRAGLRSIVVSGKGSWTDHAWNLVQIDGRFYHLDVTFDCTLGEGVLRHDYFNLSDSEISGNHSWTDKLPACPKGYGYYERTGGYVGSFRGLTDFFEKYLGKTDHLVFQMYRFTNDSKEALDAVGKMISKCSGYIRGAARTYNISVNDKRMVFQVDAAR